MKVIKQVFSKTGVYLGVFSVAITIVGIIGYDNIFGSSVSLWYRVFCVAAIFILAVGIAVAVYFCCSKVSIQLDGNRNATIGYGDVFSEEGIIIVPFNRYYDTEVNERIVGKNSLVAQFINKEYSGNTKELDTIIESQTKNLSFIENLEKDGKKKGYDIGSIVSVTKGNNTYYCVALTDVNKDGISEGDIKMYLEAVLKVLENINNKGNRQDVYMPLLGSGNMRLGKEPQEILEYLVSILKMSKIPMPSKLHILLLKKERNKFDLAKVR